MEHAGTTLFCENETNESLLFDANKSAGKYYKDGFHEYLVKDNKTAVLISYDEYASMKETLYLMSSKSNRERLDSAVEQIENANFQTKELDI